MRWPTLRTLLVFGLAFVSQDWLVPTIKPNSAANIAFGAATRLASFGSASTMNGNSPSVSGSSTLGVVKVMLDGNTTVSAPTWGAATMTEVVGAKTTGTNCASPSGGSQCTMQIFYVIAPAAGVSTVTVTTASGSWFNGAFASVEYYTGVNQTTPIDTSTHGTSASSTSFNGAFTTGVANTFVLDEAASLNVSQAPTATAPSVSIQSGTNPDWGWRSSRQGVIASAGSVTMAWTVASADSWLWSAISIRP